MIRLGLGCGTWSWGNQILDNELCFCYCGLIHSRKVARQFVKVIAIIPPLAKVIEPLCKVTPSPSLQVATQTPVVVGIAARAKVKVVLGVVYRVTECCV